MENEASECAIAWAAGLFEGEGTISRIERSADSFDLQVAMHHTDEDVIRAFAAVVDRGRLYGPYSPLSHGLRRKPFWRWMAVGDPGHDVLDLLGPWLFARRRAQARDRGVWLAEVASDLLRMKNVETEGDLY